MPGDECWHAPENIALLNLVFGTHYATEAPGIRALGERLADHARIPWQFVDEASGIF